MPADNTHRIFDLDRLPRPSVLVRRARRLVGAWRRLALAAVLAGSVAAPSAAAVEAIRIGLTPVFLDDQIAFLQSWREYLEDELQRPVQFVRRASYAEIVDLLAQGKLDFAWLCGFPFVTHRGDLDLLAVPVYRSRPLYQSYLIVPASDDRTQGIAGLKGRIFVYSDPNSNSGYLVPQFELAKLREPAQDFFRKTFFTGSHRGVIEAVAARLADGGAVDGYVYDALARLRPDIVDRTRVVQRSPFYGFPPFVVRKGVDPPTVTAFRDVLLQMPDTASGKALLDALYLDGFVRGAPRDFDGIAEMVSSLKKAGRVP
jgi:phosphonate transport system substrate-binding protein